ncbi:MAG TPA: glycerol-3-phosphate cytidiltransferase, partial [Gammaproteobacteria bacterium]|nr:glycerol-3-phosphate cytidiltransferase [Gammaproteobacteria bacterium]
NDWAGKFDDLTDQCDVVYLPRTEGISTSALKEALRVVDRSHIGDLKKALDLISSIVQRFE